MQEKFHSEDLSKYTFLITGGAGFIGSNIAAYLLKHKAGKVRVLDNLSNGSMNNISGFMNDRSFEFMEGDIRSIDTCRKACTGVDFISHQAALGSVPRSIKDPLTTHEVNSTGFLNMIISANDAGVKRFVYASTSSIYGDSPKLPKIEEETGAPLSPYAVTKKSNELYAKVFADIFKMQFIGLRYFNVFGPNQKPDGPYAAVIPLFMKSVMQNTSPFIDGDGNQTRDFCFVENIVQANVKSMFTKIPGAVNRVYNIAIGERISINELLATVVKHFHSNVKPQYRDSRPGDVRDSLANISAAVKFLEYKPLINVKDGLQITADWFRKTFTN